MVRILVDISSHGFGHLAQTAPVLNLMSGLSTNIEFYIRTAIEPSQLQSKLTMPFKLLENEHDQGMLNIDGITLDLESTFEFYSCLHHNWPAFCSDEANKINALRPDLIICNAGYVALNVAHKLNIPSVFLSSLNWADVLESVCGHFPGAQIIASQMRHAYSLATKRLCLVPGIPMQTLASTKTIPPIAQKGKNRSEELRQKFNLQRDQRIILFAFGGGMVPRPAFLDQNDKLRLCFLVPDEWNANSKYIGLDQTKMDFIDLVASCDVLVTKPGYGIFVEAACAGVAVLYLNRAKWPEEPFLCSWLHKNTRALPISTKIFENSLDDFQKKLGEVLSIPRSLKSIPAGEEKAASEILNLLPVN